MKFPDLFPSIVTDRLSLREMVASDVPAIFQIFSDPKVMRYWSTAPMAHLDEAEALVAREAEAFANRNGIKWGLTLRDEDRVIGNCTLFRLDGQNRRAEVGYALHPEFWGQGIMNEALVAMVTFAFDEAGLDLQRLEADLDPRNAVSERALSRLGFQREGLLRDRWIVDGETTDSLMMGLLRREWRASRATG